MLAGASAVDFTPVPGLILQGHLSKNPSHTVLYPLEVRALILKSGDESLCLITLDVIGVELQTTQRIRLAIEAKLQIPRDRIIVMASHTHCAPAMLQNLAMIPDPVWVASVEFAAVQCAVNASQDLTPATLGLGCGAAHFNVNRRPLPGKTEFSLNWAGVVDHRVRVLRLDSQDGKPLAVLFTFACHPTTKPGSEGFISPDYPGIARRLIEQTVECRALFVPGCFGNIRPHINGAFVAATKEQLEGVAGELATAVVKATSHVRTAAADALWVRETELTLPFGPGKPADELHKMTEDTSTLGNAVRADWARRALGRMEFGSVPRSLSSIMQAARIGPLGFVTVPGEPVQEIGYAIERALQAREGIDDLWSIGYTNDQIGYLVTERQKQEGGYEPNAYAFYDRPGPYDNEEQHIVEAASRLFP